MTQYFPHTTLNQSIVFFVLWIVGHGIAGYIIFLAIANFGLSINPLWFMICWSLFTDLGFALLQKLLLTWFDKHTKLGSEPYLSITALLALIGGYLGYLILQKINTNLNPSTVLGSWSWLAIVTALPPTIGQWWVLRLRVRHAWLWLIAGVLLLASSNLFIMIALMLAFFYEDVPSYLTLGFPVCVLISGITMLVLINSPRIDEEKRKNEMLTPP